MKSHSFNKQILRLVVSILVLSIAITIVGPLTGAQQAASKGAPVAHSSAPGIKAADDFATSRDLITASILNFEPEELRMLGYSGAAGHLKDFSARAISSEVQFCREGIKKLDAFQLTDPDEILDRAVLRAHLNYLIHFYGVYHGELGNLQISAYPFDVIEYELQRFATDRYASAAERFVSATNHFNAVEGVLRELPAYLDKQQSNLIAGLKLRAPDKKILQRMIERIGDGESLADGSIRAGLKTLDERLRSGELQSILSPHQINALHTLIENADSAYHQHLSFLKELQRHAGNSWSLGQDEYVRRLELIYGYRGSLDDLVRPAEEELRNIKEEMISVAQKLRPDLPRSNSLPVKVLQDLRQANSGSAQELLNNYERVQKKIDEHITIHLGLPLDTAHYISAPIGVPVSPATNWPAPVLSQGSAIVLVDTSADGLRSNSTVDLPWVVIHEGSSGHAAQSIFFQSAFAAGHAPLCRFLNVPDEVGYVRGNWFAMANIEGWAFHSERLLLASNLLTDAERLAALSGQALRAARVIVDVRMHTDGWSRERGAAYLITEGVQSPEVAQRESYRYSRIPLQALSYYLGANQIEGLQKHYGGQPGNHFNERFLRLGPVPPSLIDDYLGATTPAK